MRRPFDPRPLRILLPCLLAAACTTEDEALLGEEASTGELDSDGEDFRVQYLAMLDHAEVVRDDAPASKATGMISVPFLTELHGEQYPYGYRLRGTCGVTFISPHYAITAAHCVSSDNVPHPNSQQFWVTSYDLSGISEFAVGLASAVVGMFPSYDAIVDLWAQPGYTSQATLCKVVSRCSFGTYNCTTAANYDVAMLHCPNRSNTAGWLPVAASDPGTGPVEMYWFHEVLHAPTTDPGPGDAQWRDLFDHYSVYNGGARQLNYHYLEAPANVIVPLRSRPWYGATDRTRTGGGWTDMFGCHGTSGSGVLQRNAAGNLELLGPVEYGGWGTDRLCADPDLIDIGDDVVSYESNTGTRNLQSQYSTTLFWDRNPIVYWPPNPPVFDPG